jgi:hypothetical protein
MTTKLIASQGEVKQLRGRWRSGVGTVRRLTKLTSRYSPELGTFPDRGMGFSCATTRTDRCARQYLIYSDWRSRVESHAN